MTETTVRAALADRRRAQRIARGDQASVDVPIATLRDLLGAAGPTVLATARGDLGAKTTAALLAA